MNARLSHSFAGISAACLLVGTTFPASACSSGSSTITNLSNLPGVSFQVNALNSAGQLTGYLTSSGVAVEAFFYDAGTITELGTFGGSDSIGYALNASGQVVGDSLFAGDFVTHAFLYNGGPLVDLQTLGGSYSSADAINDAGQIVGGSVPAGGLDTHAFLYANGNMSDLGTLGGSYSYAFAVNSSGMVAGEADAANGDTHGFVYAGGVMTDVGTLGGNSSSVFALNDDGLAVGQSSLASGTNHGFAFAGGTLTDLGTLGGTYSTAFAVNRSGQIIGISYTTNDAQTHGFVYSAGAMTDLGTLGGDSAFPLDINNLGQIVGQSALPGGNPHAFLWRNGQMADLNTLLPPNSGWELTSAQYINDAGRIVGLGTYGGLFQWFIMDLVPGNQPPVAVAGPDQTVECGNSAALDGTASSDPDGDTLTFQWAASGTVLGTTPTLAVSLPLGTNVLTLTVTDPCGASAQTNVTVVVRDTTPPAGSCPGPASATADANCQAAVPDFRPQVVATDNCIAANQLLLGQDPAAGTLVGMGPHPLTITVTDGSGNSSTCSVLFTVLDTTPPGIQSLAANPNILSPPNGKLTPVTVSVVATDSCGPAPVSKLVSITCNPPASPGDMQITGDLTALLAANKAPANADRIYTLTVQSTDAAGNHSTGTVTVTVPHDNSVKIGTSLNPNRPR